MKFRALAVVPPTTLLDPVIRMPLPVLGRASVPDGSVPMRFPSIVFPALEITMASPAKPLMTRPRIVVSPPLRTSPVLPLPFNSISGAPTAYPGCVVPSMTSGDVIGGSAVWSVMVWTPLPGMTNEM